MGISTGRCLAASCLLLCVVFTLLSPPPVEAKGRWEGLEDLQAGVKNPHRGVYEVRGEGFVHNVGNLWVNVTNLGIIGNP
jgi:hypothetical protein